MSFPKLVDYEDSCEESESEIVQSDKEEKEIYDNVVNEQSLSYRQTQLSESDSSSSEDSDVTELDFKIVEKNDVEQVPKAKGELTIDDLPPIEDLYISVKQEECAILGNIQSIVDQLVVVQSFPGISAVDIDSILFLDEGRRALGKVFDIIGPVSQPLYCIRFNSKQHIEEKDISVGAIVYYAPRTEHTSFVFLPDLLKNKGSDASWQDDIEPPEKFLEYSDDEEERKARNVKKRLHEESMNKSDKSQNKFNQKIHDNSNRKKLNNRNNNFPMQSTSSCPNNHAYNMTPLYSMSPTYPPFPNVAHTTSTPLQPVFGTYQQAPVFNNPMSAYNMWYVNNMQQNQIRNQLNIFPPIVQTPPPPPPGT